jgi:uncharacterized LabA/DUF88 family protein
MKNPTLRQLRHKIRQLVKDISYIKSTKEQNISNLRSTWDLIKILNCNLLLDIAKDEQKLNQLFLIAQSIAETDSIGEAYGYCDTYKREAFDCRLEAVMEYYDKDTYFKDFTNEGELYWDWYELGYIEPALEIFETLNLGE